MSFHQHSRKRQALFSLSWSRETRRVGSCSKRHVTINILPDDVLLHIFFIDGERCHERPYMSLVGLDDLDRVTRLRWRWHRLVHVCRRKLMELTGIWPPCPIIITNVFNLRKFRYLEDDVFDAAIVHPDRVREIQLFQLTRSLLQRLASQMQGQCPALTHLTLHSNDSHPSALPDGFLGGSAPLLQSLGLGSIPFRALPKLLLSATHLVRLILQHIPHSGYFSPEAIVAALAGMTNLECFFIKFQSPLSRPHRENRHFPPPVHTVLPALTRFEFKGASEYLEDFASRIDAPLLDSISIVFFHQLIFDIPQLAQFMRRTTRFQQLTEAYVQFDYKGVHVTTLLPTATGVIDPDDKKSGLGISCKELDWQLSSLAQVFTSFLPSIYMVEQFYIYDYEGRYRPQYDIEVTQWLEIFHPFTAVKNLYLSKKSAHYIAPVLQELVGGRTTEVLPTLQNILLRGIGPIPEGIQKFVAARQLSGYPITVSIWDRASGRL